MANLTETVVRATLKTPKDSDGKRTSIMPYTMTDAVLDPTTKQPLNQMLESITYTDATKTSSGLMSATDKGRVDAMNDERVIISATEPITPCMWYEVLSQG